MTGSRSGRSDRTSSSPKWVGLPSIGPGNAGEPGGGVGAGELVTDHRPLTAADFQIDVKGSRPRCSIEEYELKDAPERVEVHFAGTTCEPCPLRSRCPVKLDRRAGAYVLKADLVKVNIERRRKATEEYKGRDRGNELRAEARPRAWALAGASLPEGVGVQLQADGPCTPGGDGEHGSAGGRDGTCGRGRMRAPLHNFHRVP